MKFGDVIGCLESVVSFFMQDCHLELRKKELWYTDCIFKTNTLASDIFTYMVESHEHIHVYLTPKYTIKNKKLYFA